MFDLSWSEILIVMIVALVVVGPKDLPRLMHMLGRWIAKARAMATEFRNSFDEMARQAELDELRKEIAALRAERPLASLDQTLNHSIEHGILPAETHVEPPQPEPPQAESPQAESPQAAPSKADTP